MNHIIGQRINSITSICMFKVPNIQAHNFPSVVCLAKFPRLPVHVKPVSVGFNQQPICHRLDPQQSLKDNLPHWKLCTDIRTFRAKTINELDYIGRKNKFISTLSIIQKCQLCTNFPCILSPASASNPRLSVHMENCLRRVRLNNLFSHQLVSEQLSKLHLAHGQTAITLTNMPDAFIETNNKDKTRINQRYIEFLVLIVCYDKARIKQSSEAGAAMSGDDSRQKMFLIPAEKREGPLCDYR